MFVVKIVTTIFLVVYAVISLASFLETTESGKQAANLVVMLTMISSIICIWK